MWSTIVEHRWIGIKYKERIQQRISNIREVRLLWIMIRKSTPLYMIAISFKANQSYQEHLTLHEAKTNPTIQ